MYFLGGWPGKLFKVLLGPAIPQATITEFSKDNAAWEKLKSLSPVPAGLSPVLERSLFKVTAVRQLVAACKEHGWRPHPDLHALLSERSLAIIGTQL
eukprot:2910026-Heterocapsa_arctica.AAC.1